MKNGLIALVSILFIAGLATGADHILITEFCVTPTNGEFVEIYNPTGGTIDLTNYYLADYIYNNDNDYVNIVDGSDTGYYQDFMAQFPVGATIDAGEYQVISVQDDLDFSGIFPGVIPDYELVDDSGGTDEIPDMLDAGAGGIGSSPGLTNSGESVVLFFWDGATDLVQDVDYVVWGDKNEAIDKTGVAKDGPDGDTDPTTYADDTAVLDQTVVNTDNDGDDTPHSSDNTAQRAAPEEEYGETQTGGNGITGHDETSEDLSFAGGSWIIDAPGTPGSGAISDMPPDIYGVGYAPCSPEAAEAVGVRAYITDDVGISVAETYYSIDGGANWTPLTMTYTGGDIYLAEIPGQVADTYVDFYVYTEDTYGHQIETGTYHYLVGTFETIFTIQSDTTAGGASNYEDLPVNVTGYVSAGNGIYNDHTFYIADDASAAPWEGIKVYSYYANPTVVEGDYVSIAGLVDEYYGETEINASNAASDTTNCITILDNGYDMVAYDILTGDIPGEESLEGVLVQTTETTVTDTMNQYGEWKTDDGSGECIVDDYAGYGYVPAIGDEKDVAGIVMYSYGNFKLQPRSDADITDSGTQILTVTNIDPPSVGTIGGSVSWTVEVSNLTDDPVVFDLWLEIDAPATDAHLRKIIVNDYTIPANYTGQGTITVAIPGTANEMTVFVDTTVGQLPDTAYDSDSFYLDLVN